MKLFDMPLQLHYYDALNTAAAIKIDRQSQDETNYDQQLQMAEQLRNYGREHGLSLEHRNNMPIFFALNGGPEAWRAELPVLPAFGDMLEIDMLSIFRRSMD